MKRFLICALVLLWFSACTGERQPVENSGANVTASTTPTGNVAGEAVRISGEGVEATEPAVAAGADGKVFVAYVQKDGEAGDIFVRAYEPASKRMSEPVRVNPVQGQAKSWFGDPPTIALGADGRVFVGWTAKYPDGGKGTILYLSVSGDGGATFAEPVKVNDDAEPASHGMHSMAVARDGKIHFAWLDERYLRKLPPARHGGGHSNTAQHPTEAEVEPNAELYYAVSSDGRTFSENRKLDADVCPCCKTSTAVSEAGQVAIGYRKVFEGERRHIAVASPTDVGEGMPRTAQVSDDQWRITACPVSGPALRFEGDSLAVAWYLGGEAAEKGIYVTHSTGNIMAFEPRRMVSTGSTAGSPEWAGPRLFWSKEGEIESSDIAGGAASSIGAGKGVAAARAGDTSFVAYVVQDGERKSVWLRAIGPASL